MKLNIRLASYILMAFGAAGYLSFALLVPTVMQLSFISWLVGVAGVGLYAFDVIKVLKKKYSLK